MSSLQSTGGCLLLCSRRCLLSPASRGCGADQTAGGSAVAATMTKSLPAVIENLQCGQIYRVKSQNTFMGWQPRPFPITPSVDPLRRSSLVHPQTWKKNRDMLSHGFYIKESIGQKVMIFITCYRSPIFGNGSPFSDDGSPFSGDSQSWS